MADQQDKPFAIAFDGYTESRGVGMGDSSGYPTRVVWNVSDIGKHWRDFLDKGHGIKLKPGVRCYKLVEIDRAECLRLMAQRCAQDEEEARQREIAQARARLKELGAL